MTAIFRKLSLSLCFFASMLLIGTQPALSVSKRATIELTQAQRDLIETYFVQEIQPWSTYPLLIRVLRAQNKETNGYSAAELKAFDDQWHAERSAGDGELTAKILENVASEFLFEKVAEFGGIISEMFLTDAVGLNAAATMPTEDFWQGDEPKFTETQLKSLDAIYVSDIEYNPITHVSEVQVTIPIVDFKDNKSAGTLTVALVADILLIE